MVHDGYRLLDSSGRPLRGSAPPPGWNGVENVWRFVYTRPGAAATFQLQCSLHPSNRRMFVHACELDSNGEPRPDNIQILGVQLPRYVPADDADVSQAASWDGEPGTHRRTHCTSPAWLAHP